MNIQVDLLILFGETWLWRAIFEYLAHFQQERNHESKENVLLFPEIVIDGQTPRDAVCRRERLGGLLKF